MCIRDRYKAGYNHNSDLWRAYDGKPDLPGMNFLRLTVNQSQNFVDPVCGAHTQMIESLWVAVKRRNKCECGTSRNQLDSYLVNSCGGIATKTTICFKKFG